MRGGAAVPSRGFVRFVWIPVLVRFISHLHDVAAEHARVRHGDTIANLVNSQLGGRFVMLAIWVGLQNGHVAKRGGARRNGHRRADGRESDAMMR